MDGTRSALIVASDDYTDPGLRRLRAPASDAQALAAVLRDPQIGGFEVRTLLNEPAHEVNLAVEEFFADRRPDDLLLLHFSCHGVKDEGGELYFATANTLLRRLGATAVAAEFVNRRMSRSRSRRVVLLLDCCYAGAFERGMTARAGAGIAIEEQFGGRGRAVITASSSMEYAFEGDQLADTRELAPSVFTSALVEGLETGEADRDQDGMVALDELYDYVYDKVREATPNQTPGKWTFAVQGDLYIARRSRPVTTPAPLPPELQQAIDSPFAAVRAGAVQELTRLLQSRHAGLALAAKLALQRLTNDDSRAVSAAAEAALGAQTQPPAPPKPLPPAPPKPPAATMQPEAGPEVPQRARLGPRQDAAIPPMAQDDVPSMLTPAGNAPDPSTTEPPKAPEQREQAGRSATPSIPPAGPAAPSGARPSSDQSKPPDRQRRRLSTRTRILAGVGVGVVLIPVLIVAITANSDATPCPPPEAFTTTSPSTGSVKPPKVVFQDDFSDRVGGWDDAGSEPAGGHYTNGAYRFCVESVRGGHAPGSAPFKASSVYPSAPPDLRIEVDARRLAGDEDGAYGIFCRADGENFYAFRLGDGYVNIEKFLDHDPLYTGLKDAGTAIDVNATNRLRAECTSVEGQQAVHLRFSVNGQVVADTTDTVNPLLTGTVGLLAGTGRTAKKAVEAEFDNFVVTRV